MARDPVTSTLRERRSLVRAIKRVDMIKAAPSLVFAFGISPKRVSADEITTQTISEGLEGSRGAAPGDWVLVEYVGKVASTGTVFDSTRGGMQFLNGGQSEFQPRLFQLNINNPQPGIVKGLYSGIEGMKVGEVRKVAIPPSEGFGSSSTMGPFAVIPPNTEIEYEVRIGKRYIPHDERGHKVW
eukprot:CAMPEP_0114520782 /NCGR_PEP_ID=MMETSP0109-20121206/19809_1 /TAXON_ID=29199 /ORGANISM="Chlorarachnion reptans, Strain CCCM449" /LENGTH=183 /DNA_ID=CAMNT_0001701789 /DNA_START=169 /DNA_END=717 /DNA_ORIENTATION=+